MANKQGVKVGRKANIFHDQTTGITVKKGQVVELTAAQLMSRRVKGALSSGHLVRTEEKATTVTKTEVEEPKVKESKPKFTAEELVEKFRKHLGEDGDIETILADKDFTKENLETVAGEFYIEVDSNDTKRTIIEAIIEEISAEDDEE